MIQIPDNIKGKLYPPYKEREFADLLANIMMEMEATKEEVQEKIDEIIMEEF